MRKNKKILIFLIVFATMLIIFMPSALADNEEEESFSISIEVQENTVNEYYKDEIYYLFVPKDVDLTNMAIKYTGNIISVNNENLVIDTNLQQITGNFETYSEFTVTLSNEEEKSVEIMQSDAPAIFINLDEDKTLEEVNSGSKEIKYSASLSVSGCENSDDNISQSGIEFKGRGNSSWKMDKKSYQIKLSKKANFLGLGTTKEKKWVLIANYQDPTLMKNKIMNDLCVNTGLSECPKSTYADLYVNGDYIGNYLVCDKIEIDTERVNLTDSKGVLVELDNAYYEEEDYWFKSNRGNYYTIKESVSEDEETITSAMNSFESALNEFETELYSSNPSWEKISSMIDVESFVKYYLINEFAENTDSYYSSCYFYKDGDDDVIHMGPTWDYDGAFGYGSGDSKGGNASVDYTLNYAYANEMQRLYRFPEFASLVNEFYSDYLKEELQNIDVDAISAQYENSIKINTIVWSDESTYETLKSELKSWINERIEYFDTRYSNSQIEYSTHVQNKGWTTSIRSGVSGTEGQELRLEGLKIEIGDGYGEDVSISYRTHVQDIGWQSWVQDGELAGTTGQSLRLEAVEIKLNNTSKYSVRYRVHIQDIGWSDWYYDGETAGTVGQCKRIEAIEIQIVESAYQLGNSSKNTSALINYKGHIQDIGNTGWASDGETIGTSGKCLRLEGLQIELGDELAGMYVEVNEHIQDIGWKCGLTNNDYIGTTGQCLRLEALSFVLKGTNSENYRIKYRVHVQDVGWQGWKYDGEIAGTEGQCKRIEAIQIAIEKTES